MLIALCFFRLFASMRSPHCSNYIAIYFGRVGRESVLKYSSSSSSPCEKHSPFIGGQKSGLAKPPKRFVRCVWSWSPQEEQMEVIKPWKLSGGLIRLWHSAGPMIAEKLILLLLLLLLLNSVAQESNNVHSNLIDTKRAHCSDIELC